MKHQQEKPDVRKRARLANLEKANKARKEKYELQKKLIADLTRKVDSDMPDAIENAADRAVVDFLKKQSRESKEEIFRAMILNLAIGKEKQLRSMLSQTSHPEYSKFMLGFMRIAASLSEQKQVNGNVSAGVVVNISGIEHPVQVQVCESR